MNPLLAATDSTMKVQSKTNGARFIKVNEFFLSYRKTALQSDEVIVDVTVPKTGEFEFVFPFKQAKRREDDISIVTSAMRVKLEVAQDKSGFVVAESAFAFGGMAAKVRQEKEKEKYHLFINFNTLRMLFADCRRPTYLGLPEIQTLVIKNSQRGQIHPVQGEANRGIRQLQS